MTKYRNELSQNMEYIYSCRSLIRGFYLNLNQSEEYKLTSLISNYINSNISPKYNCDVVINIKEFNISINNIDMEKIGHNKLMSISSGIFSILHDYLLNNANNEIKNYLSDEAKHPIFDFFIIGNSIKFLL